MRINLRAKRAVNTPHQLAYVGVPFDSSEIRMNLPWPPCRATSRRESPFFFREQLTSPHISDVNYDHAWLSVRCPSRCAGTFVNTTRYPSFSCLLLRHVHLSRCLGVNSAHPNVRRSGILAKRVAIDKVESAR